MPRWDGPTTLSCPHARNLAYLSALDPRARRLASSGSSALQRPHLASTAPAHPPTIDLAHAAPRRAPSGKFFQGRPPCMTHQLNSAHYRASRLRPQAGVQVACLSHQGGCLHGAARSATPEHSLAKSRSAPNHQWSNHGATGRPGEPVPLHAITHEKRLKFSCTPCVLM